MKILFTKTNSVLSRAIRGVTKEPVSHCAIKVGDFVIHSNLLGVHIEWAANFEKKNTVVLELRRPHPATETKLGKVLERTEFSAYDFGALLFVGISLLARKHLGLPLPQSNLWQSSGMFICTEWVCEFVDDKIDSMITPYGLYQRLKANGWGEVDDKEGQVGDTI